ncbi:MAG: WG repeat-containing protein [Prevotella sp.]|nr:WG repeat-containing protein [Prevotella sp.]
MKTNKNLWRATCCVAVAALMLSSCEKKKSDSYTDFDYMPVQMSKGDGWSIIDKDGKEVVKEEYPADAKLSLIYDGVYWVKQNDKYQLFNLKDPKKPLIDEEFTRVTTFRAGHAAVSNPNHPIRIINTKGETVATLQNTIKRCGYFSEEGYAVFMANNNKLGILDTRGKVVVKPDYDDMKDLVREGLILAKKSREDKKWLIIDMKGQKVGQVDEEKYYFLTNSFHEGKLLVRNANDEKGYAMVLDKTGKKILDLKKAVEGYGSEEFIDGYLAFENGEDKYGVADDKGEILIRAKYDYMWNIGNGRFIAKKGDKWGVVNTKDEPILDFDYDMGVGTMGSNYLMHDGSGYVLVNKDGKEMQSFDSFNYGADHYAEYVDVDGLANALKESINELESAPTPAKLAKKLNLNIDNCHYQSYIAQEQTIDDKVKGSYTIYFNGYIAEEKTHVEKVNDGWFTYDRTVSDGWGWSTPRISMVSGKFQSTDESISLKTLYSSLLEKIAQGRKKISDNTYSKNIKVGGKNVECKVTLSLNDDNIGLNINYTE